MGSAFSAFSTRHQNINIILYTLYKISVEIIFKRIIYWEIN